MYVWILSKELLNTGVIIGIMQMTRIFLGTIGVFLGVFSFVPMQKTTIQFGFFWEKKKISNVHREKNFFVDMIFFFFSKKSKLYRSN